MRAILQDIPLGVRRYEMGLTLRQAWFLNGTLYNSEVWCALSKSDLNVLEVLDQKILRLILGAHSKAPSEMLYLETGVLPIPHVVTLRRLCYLKNILNRNDNEIKAGNKTCAKVPLSPTDITIRDLLFILKKLKLF